MRLLAKTDIHQRQASARKLEIDEGKKLAESVDTLRELKVTEEQNLEQFRAKTIARIHQDIASEQDIYDALKAEVRTLEARRKEALKPLDVEWTALNDAKQMLDDRSEYVKDREQAAYAKEESVKVSEKEVEKLLVQAKTKDERAEQLLLEADNSNKEATQRLSNATKTEKKAMELKEKTESELLERETLVAVRERDVGFKETNIADEIARIDKEWKLLEDRKRMQARNIIRLTK